MYLSDGKSDGYEMQRKSVVLNEIARAYKANGDKENASRCEMLFGESYMKLESRM